MKERLMVSARQIPNDGLLAELRAITNRTGETIDGLVWELVRIGLNTRDEPDYEPMPMFSSNDEYEDESSF